jgi:hypothetical protein
MLKDGSILVVFLSWMYNSEYIGKTVEVLLEEKDGAVAV